MAGVRVVCAVLALVLAVSAARGQGAAEVETAAEALAYLKTCPVEVEYIHAERMERLIAEALEAAPEDPDLLLAQALVCEHTNHGRVGLRAAEMLRDRDPDDAWTQYAWGLMLLETLDEHPREMQSIWGGRARRAFERALELDPTIAGARVKVMEYYLQAPEFSGGDPRVTRRYALEQLEVEGQEHIAHYYLAKAAVKEEDWPRMQYHFAMSAEVSPTRNWRRHAVFGLVWTLHTHRDSQREAAELAMAAADDEFADDYRFHFVAAEALRAMGDCDRALLYYQQVRELLPDSPDSDISRARCLEQLGRIEEAIGAYREFLDTYFAEFGDADDRIFEAKKALERFGVEWEE